MSKQIISINEGLTYEYVIHGVVTIIAGLLLLLVSPNLTLIFIIGGIVLLTIKTGIDIDTENQKLRKFKSIPFLKFGEWIDLKKIILVELKYNANTANTTGPPMSFFAMGVVMPNAGGTIKTFDLFFQNDVGEEILINQFLKLGPAAKTLKLLEKINHLKIVNHFDAMLQESKKDRRR